MSYRRLLIALLPLTGLGCRSWHPAPATTEATQEHRHIIGPPTPWQPATLDQAALDQAMRTRRVAAWAAVAQAITPVTVLDPSTKAPLLDSTSGAPLRIPVWQTWYEVSEFKGIMRLMWQRLSPEQRAAAQPPDAVVDQAMADFPHQVLDAHWSSSPHGSGPSRFETLLAQIKNQPAIRTVNGVSSAGYTLFSPGLVRHYLRHYRSVAACAAQTPPQMAASGGSADFATCFGEAFPTDAVAIKATWNQVGAGGVAVFDTSAKGLGDLLSTDGRSWTPRASQPLADPDEQHIYTATTYTQDHTQRSFRLTGLHLITKEIPNWLWTTLWWSNEPDSDFGEDRPDSVVHVDGGEARSVWANYKMCTVSAFDEGDDALSRQAAALNAQVLSRSTDSSLAAALAAATYVGQGHTFCSNPFIESQPSNGQTNCLGCHQHAGPAAPSSRRLDRARMRTTFMTDFLWSFEDDTESFRGAINAVLSEG